MESTTPPHEAPPPNDGFDGLQTLDQSVKRLKVTEVVPKPTEGEQKRTQEEWQVLLMEAKQREADLLMKAKQREAEQRDMEAKQRDMEAKQREADLLMEAKQRDMEAMQREANQRDMEAKQREADLLMKAKQREAELLETIKQAEMVAESMKKPVVARLKLRHANDQSPPRVSESIVRESLDAVTWPSAASVKLYPLILPMHHPHKVSFVGVPKHPGTSRPYMLGIEDANDTRPDALFDMMRSGKDNVVVFAASGAGKTWITHQLYRKRFGLFIVPIVPGDKNDGSFDASKLFEALEKHMTNGDYARNRRIAEYGVACLIHARARVFEEWKRICESKNESFDFWQWLLVQVFPNHFFGQDVFEKLTTELFEKTFKADLTMPKLPETKLFAFTVVDEAQILLVQFEKKFESKQFRSTGDAERPVSLRSFLSPFLSAVQEYTVAKVIISGTGISMLAASKSAASATGVIANPWDRTFKDLPLMSEADVVAYVRTYLNLSGCDASTIKSVGIWLQGRRRFSASFVELVVSDASMDIQSHLTAFINLMAKETRENRSIADILKRLEERKGVNNIPFYDYEFEPVEAKNVWSEVVQNAFLHMNGFNAKFDEKYAPAFVELGLACRTNTKDFSGASNRIKLARFEPIVLEVCRRRMTVDHMTQWILKGIDEAGKGKRFEVVMPFFKAFDVMGTKRLVDYFVMPRLRTKIASTSVFLSVFQSFPPQYGRVAAQFECRDLVVWFDECWANRETPESSKWPFAFYPDDNAGPDYVALLRVVGNSEASFALVFAQCKFGANAEWKDSSATVDPALLYKCDRTKTPKPTKSPVEGLDTFFDKIKHVPIIRLVLTAKHNFRKEGLSEIIHCRPGNWTFKSDLLVVVSTKASRESCFGNGIGGQMENL